MASARPLLIGIGNPFAGDDAVGHLVVARVAEAVSGIDVREATGEALELMALFEGRDFVIVVDACCADSPTGSVQRFDAWKDPLPASVGKLSSHGLGLADAIEMARTLGELPQTCIICAIVGECFDFGKSVSPSVLASIARLSARLSDEFIKEGLLSSD